MSTSPLTSSTATSRPQASAEFSAPPQAAPAQPAPTQAAPTQAGPAQAASAPAPEATPAGEQTKDTYGTTETEAPDLSGSASKDAMTPAVMRAAVITGAKMKIHHAAAVAARATAFIMKHPEMVAAFRQALPVIAQASTNNPSVLRVAGAISNQGMARALLTTAREVGGPAGTRMMGAVLRGLGKGGVPHAAAELGATAAKVGVAAQAGTTMGKGLSKAMPLIGNAANLISVGVALHKMINALEDPNASRETILAHTLHVATSVAGCFVPPVGVVGDIAFAAYRANERKEANEQDPFSTVSDVAMAGLRATTKGVGATGV